MPKKEIKLVTSEPVQTQEMIDQLISISHQREGVLIIAGDVASDNLFAMFQGDIITAKIKGEKGEEIELVKKVLNYNNDKKQTNSFLHFVDAVISAMADSQRKKRLASKKKLIKKPKK